MPDNPIDRFAYLLNGGTVQFDGTLVDADFVGQNQPIVVSSFCLWNAVVKTQEFCWVACLRRVDRGRVGPIFDHDLNIVQLPAEFCRQGVDGLDDKVLKIILFHRRHYTISWV